MIPALHNYSHLAGKTTQWDTSDNLQQYHKNLQDPVRKQQLINAGYDDQCISYQFNSHGFRTSEFDQKFDIVCFGCSFTMGTGVRREHTWPNQLSQATNFSVANLGHAGSSNDTAFRLADHYLKFLLPRWAVWLQTDQHRLEIIDEDRDVALNILSTDSDNWYADNPFVKTWMSSDINQSLNLKKNTGAFENLCRALNIVPVVVTRSQMIYNDFGRDLSHPGQRSYKELSLKIKQLIHYESV
jgi:hypothetical protein